MRHFIRIWPVYYDNRSSETEMQNIFVIITCDPSINAMDNPDLTVSHFMEKSIGMQRVNMVS